MRLLLPLVALTLLAGCTRPEDVGSAAVDPATANVTDAAADVATAVENGTAALVEHPIAFEGKVPRYAEACAFTLIMAQCRAVPPGTEFGTMRTELEVPGALVSGRVTATWTPSDPTHQEMVLYAFSFSTDDWVSHGFVVGPSGLSLELENVEEYQKGRTLRMGIAPPSYGARQGNVGAWGAGSPTEQPFKLDGLLVVQH